MLSLSTTLALAIVLFASPTSGTTLGFEYSFPDVTFEEKEREVAEKYDIDDECAYFGRHYDDEIYRSLVTAMFGALKWREGVCRQVTKRSHKVHRLACHRATVAEHAGELMMAMYHARILNVLPPSWMKYMATAIMIVIVAIVCRFICTATKRRVANRCERRANVPPPCRNGRKYFL